MTADTTETDNNHTINSESSEEELLELIQKQQELLQVKENIIRFQTGTIEELQKQRKILLEKGNFPSEIYDLHDSEVETKEEEYV